MALLGPSQFLAGKHNFSLRTATESNVMLGVTFSPLAVNKGVGDSCIERVVTHGNILLFDVGPAKQIGPVVEVVNLDSLPGNDLCRPFWCCRKSKHQKLSVVRDLAMARFASHRKAGFIGSPWALSKCRVIERVIYLICILSEAPVELLKRPDCLALGIYGLGHLANAGSDLRVAFEIVEKLTIGGSEQTLANRAKARLRGGPRLLDRFIPGQECFEVGAVKLAAPVHYHDLRETRMPTDTFAKHHHAGTVTWRIEGQV